MEPQAVAQNGLTSRQSFVQSPILSIDQLTGYRITRGKIEKESGVLLFLSGDLWDIKQHPKKSNSGSRLADRAWLDKDLSSRDA